MFCQKHRLKIASLRIGKYCIVKKTEHCPPPLTTCWSLPMSRDVIEIVVSFTIVIALILIVTIVIMTIVIVIIVIMSIAIIIINCSHPNQVRARNFPQAWSFVQCSQVGMRL